VWQNRIIENIKEATQAGLSADLKTHAGYERHFTILHAGKGNRIVTKCKIRGFV
jgi:hypothetical protein